MYVRVSTLKDSQKDSPEHQESACREHAASIGITINDDMVYEDRDTGTSIIARSEIQQLINDAKKGLFDTILFSSLSRFSRDTLDALALKRTLVNALGVRVISVEDFYDSGKEDNEMLFGILSSVNQKQSEQIGTASKRGIRQSAMKGNFTGTIPPYGYKKVTIDGRKTLEVVPDQAEVVRQIFELYTKHKMGEKAITSYLNEQDKLSAKGGIWGISSIQRILNNEVYTGYNVFSKLESKKVYDDINDMHNRRKKQVYRSEDKWDRTPFKTHEAIISEETFRKTQELRLLRGGGKRGGNKNFVNVFAKMIFCKECGSAMVAMSSISREKRYVYLMCSKRRRQGEKGCSNATWTPYIEFRDGVIEYITNNLKDFEDVKRVADRVSNGRPISEAAFEKESLKFNRQIEGNRKLLFEIRKQNMTGDIDEAQYNYEKEQYEKDILEATNKLKALQEKVNGLKEVNRLAQDISEAMNELLEMDHANVQKNRLILSKLINKIEVPKDGPADIYTVL